MRLTVTERAGPRQVWSSPVEGLPNGSWLTVTGPAPLENPFCFWFGLQLSLVIRCSSSFVTMASTMISHNDWLHRKKKKIKSGRQNLKKKWKIVEDCKMKNMWRRKSYLAWAAAEKKGCCWQIKKNANREKHTKREKQSKGTPANQVSPWIVLTWTTDGSYCKF